MLKAYKFTASRTRLQLVHTFTLAMQDSKLRAKSRVFDLDKQWSNASQYVHYDFHKPEQIPEELFHSFDGIVIDPPFVTEEVWLLYAKAVDILLAPGGKLICTTIAENEKLLARLFGVTAAAYKPSIPNLCYQYDLFCNYKLGTHSVLAKLNPELPA